MVLVCFYDKVVVLFETQLSRFSPPGLCPDWDQWDQTKPVDNAREAMQQADDWLGIPQVGDQSENTAAHSSS